MWHKLQREIERKMCVYKMENKSEVCMYQYSACIGRRYYYTTADNNLWFTLNTIASKSYSNNSQISGFVCNWQWEKK